jgi:hypothetical protein
LYSTKGHLLKVIPIHKSQQAVDVADLAKGVYVVKLNTKYFRVLK